MRAPSFRACLGGFLLAAAGSAIGAVADAPAAPPVLLTNAAQVRKLTAAQAAESRPVRLAGVVLDTSDPRDHALLMADSTAGIYVRAANRLFAGYRRGDSVEVEGVTDPGQFAPIVVAKVARKRGKGTLPTPQAVTYQRLIAGTMDAQWVELSGVVRRCLTGNGTTRLLVEVDGGMVPVRHYQPLEGQVEEDAEVRVQAVCLYQFNAKRQLLNPVLQVPTGVPIRVLRPAPSDPFSAPVRRADSLLQFSSESPSRHRLHVRGVVTCCQPGSALWIRDETCGLHVQTYQVEPCQPGDEVDVLGFLALGSPAPVLEHAIFRKTGVTLPPSPLALPNATAAFDHEDDLVSLEANLAEVQPTVDGFALTLEQPGKVFKAMLKLPASRQYRPPWQPGSQVRVVGICSLLHENVGTVQGIWQPQSFQLLLRSPEDVTLIKPPPWWTARHITLVLGIITAASALVAGAVVWLARRRVREQERQRSMAEAEFAAILSERNRVAREIHDTLAQGLVATSLQLRLARKNANGSPAALMEHLDSAQQLVSGSLEEARSSIWNMRSQVLETGDLAAALQGILKQMADGTEVQAVFEAKGRVRRLAPVIENNLLRIGQEAITNASKHANAHRVAVELDFGEKQFRLTVSDDGQGFDIAKPVSKEGGFGLVGMRERAAHLKGELDVQSVRGQGTRLTLIVPLSGE